MSEAFFDLATPRTILLFDRDRVYTLSCRRITDGDWREYFSGITITAEQDGKSRITPSTLPRPAWRSRRAY